METTTGGQGPPPTPAGTTTDSDHPVPGPVTPPGRRTFRRWIRLAVLSLTALATLAAAQPLGNVTMSGFTSEERQVVISAVRRYQAAGLELPRTHIRRVGNGEHCGVTGRSWDLWPVKIVNVCLVREDVVVHELAHLWSFTALSRFDKIAWGTRRHASTWRSRAHRWEDRGAEHAADIITWQLYWSEAGVVPGRISGDVSAETFRSDVEWLLTTASTPEQTAAHRATGPFRHPAPGTRSPVSIRVAALAESPR